MAHVEAYDLQEREGRACTFLPATLTVLGCLNVPVSHGNFKTYISAVYLSRRMAAKLPV